MSARSARPDRDRGRDDVSNPKNTDQEEAAEMPEDNRGIYHTGPETVEITGAAIGTQGGSDYPSPDRDAEPDSSTRGNSGVQSFGTGQINMSGCVTGDGAFLIVGGARAPGTPSGPDPEPEAG